MSVLVDTSVWSLGLRRRFRDLNPVERAIFFRWESLIKDGEAVLIGPICQEVLAGIAVPQTFEQIRQRLILMEELPLTIDAFVLAAQFYNACRARGTAPGFTDMTICAAANLHNTRIFTTDPDFTRYADILPISLITR